MNHRRRVWKLPAFVAVVLTTLILAVLIQYVGLALLHVVRQRYDASQLALILGARETVALVAAGGLAKLCLGASWSDLGLRRPSGRQILIGGVLGLMLTALTTGLLAAIGSRSDTAVDTIVRAAAYGTPPWRLVLFAVIGLYSPIVQEVVFRGLLLQGLMQRMHVALALGMSSAIFAFAHAGAGALSVADTFVFGVLQGALFVRYRSLTAPIASHVAANSASMLVVIWALHRAGW